MVWSLQLQTRVLGCVLSTYWSVQFVTGTATDSKAHERWETVKMETHTCLLVCLIYLSTLCTYIVSFMVGSPHLYKLNTEHTWHRHEYGNIAHHHICAHSCQDKYGVVSCCYSMHRTPIKSQWEFCIKNQWKDLTPFKWRSLWYKLHYLCCAQKINPTFFPDYPFLLACLLECAFSPHCI